MSVRTETHGITLITLANQQYAQGSGTKCQESFAEVQQSYLLKIIRTITNKLKAS